MASAAAGRRMAAKIRSGAFLTRPAPNQQTLRELALGTLRNLLGDPTRITPNGEYWDGSQRPSEAGCFDVHLNSPTDPGAAEVTVLSGPHLMYQVRTRNEDELRLGLRVVEMIVRP